MTILHYIYNIYQIKYVIYSKLTEHNILMTPQLKVVQCGNYIFEGKKLSLRLSRIIKFMQTYDIK